MTAERLKAILNSLDHFPTTRLRVFTTIGLIVATGVVYLSHACDTRVNGVCVGWEPSVNWLMFLSALAGVDVTQYFAKSYTNVKMEKAKQENKNALLAPQHSQQGKG